MDRLDMAYMRETHKEQQEERKKDLASAGPLFNDDQRMQIEFQIEQETRLPRGDVDEIIGFINEYAGQDDTPVLETIKEALNNHVSKPAFVKRVAQELEAPVTQAIAAREERIQQLKSPQKESAQKPQTSRMQTKVTPTGKKGV